MWKSACVGVYQLWNEVVILDQEHEQNWPFKDEMYPILYTTQFCTAN